MTERPATSIELLLRASSSDEETLGFPVPDAAFGFHAQQAVEKLMKALLTSQTGSYPFTHDLLSLRKRIERSGITLPLFPFNLEKLTEYAGNSRYDVPFPLDDDLRLLLQRAIAELRSFVLQQTKQRQVESDPS